MNQGYKMLGSDTCTFQVHDVDFVQLLNCHHSHWICVTKKNSRFITVCTLETSHSVLRSDSFIAEPASNLHLSHLFLRCNSK